MTAIRRDRLRESKRSCLSEGTRSPRQETVKKAASDQEVARRMAGDRLSPDEPALARGGRTASGAVVYRRLSSENEYDVDKDSKRYEEVTLSDNLKRVRDNLENVEFIDDDDAKEVEVVASVKEEDNKTPSDEEGSQKAITTEAIVYEQPRRSQ